LQSNIDHNVLRAYGARDLGLQETVMTWHGKAPLAAGNPSSCLAADTAAAAVHRPHCRSQCSARTPCHSWCHEPTLYNASQIIQPGKP